MIRTDILRMTIAGAGLLASATLGTAGLSTSTYSTGADAWNGSPVLTTTTTPGTSSTVNAGGNTNTAVTVSFTPGSTFTLDKFAVVVAGGPSQGTINLYQAPVGGGAADGFVNVSFSTSLWGGGSGLAYTFGGTPSETILEFDLTGLDEITLSAGTKYAIDFIPNQADTTFNFYLVRGGEFYGGGNLYANSNVSGSPAGERYNVAGSTRDAPLAVYAVAAVPEPSIFALAGLGLAGLLIFRRR